MTGLEAGGNQEAPPFLRRCLMPVKATVLALTLLLGTLALPVLADHGGRGGGSGLPGVSFGDGILTNGRFLAHYLNLSTSQTTQLQGFLKTLPDLRAGRGDGPRPPLPAAPDGHQRQPARPDDGGQGLPRPGRQPGQDQDRPP